MAQWGRNDHAVTANGSTTIETSNGAPMGVSALVKGGLTNHSTNAHYGNTSSGSRAQIDYTLYGNTTIGAFIPGVAKGVFGIDATEATSTGGPVVEGIVTFAGSGYGANTANLTVTATNGGSGAVVNAVATTGKITGFNITGGSGYITNPTVTISAPATITLNGNTAVSNDTITLTSANSYFAANDGITVSANATSLPGGLASGTRYYVAFSNTSALKLSATPGGANIVMTKASGDNTTAGGFGLIGDTATGYLVAGGNHGIGITHAGWILRTEGTGGRAGRVQYETLVAMGSLGTNTTTSTGVTGNADTVTDGDNSYFPPSN